MHKSNDKNTNIQELKDMLKKFREERAWTKFHNPKDIAMGISIEAAEFLELFAWRKPEDIEHKLVNDPNFRERVEEELADVINYCLAFSLVTNIDVASAVKTKIGKNIKKYPIEQVKGCLEKYNAVKAEVRKKAKK